ncbi:restriction endonuclease subunit S [Gordonia alkanivorans]|uniref:restriction endonuclease subunit S n=1 Tax=Gordonia TaxID=2053 RepID=UPI001FFC18C7|nr:MULTISPECIES: restriction endonuclease subunit S [Gordonia]MDJ0025921.1 restriction endonuclease subunit S [Gordonia alkanivorans]UPG69174.1 restriction endonuclease subunit S [Gordonia hongkongensis]
MSETISLRHLVRNRVEKSDGAPRRFIGLEAVMSGVGRLISADLPLKDASDSLLTRPGDILFGKLRPYLSKTVHIEGGDVSCTGEFLVLEPSEALSSRYLYYLTLSKPWLDTANQTSFGSRMPRTSWEALASMQISCPPRDVQAILAAYLDRETAKIDALIAKQEQLIATLQEDRIATITHAVTRGISVHALRKSAAEWLERIPTHWKVMPFVRCTIDRVDYRGATPRKTDSGVQLITARNVKQGWIDYGISEEYVDDAEYEQVMRRGIPQLGDLLLTMEAPLGNVALVDRTDIALAQRIIKFRMNPNVIIPEFTRYVLLSAWFQAQLISRATGSTALGLKASKLPELKVTVPPVAEQKEITAFLDDRESSIGHLKRASEISIATLREYRAALITDAVTGKIDVRETV